MSEVSRNLENWTFRNKLSSSLPLSEKVENIYNLKKWALQAILKVKDVFPPYMRGWRRFEVRAQEDGEGRDDRKK